MSVSWSRGGSLPSRRGRDDNTDVTATHSSQTEVRSGGKSAPRSSHTFRSILSLHSNASTKRASPLLVQPIPSSMSAAMEKPSPQEPDPLPYGHNFFDNKHAGFKRSRNTYLKVLVLQVILIILTTWGVLAIYWGALWRPNHGIHNLNGWIVDFDGGAMGQVVREALLNVTGPKTGLDWRVIDPSMFPGGQDDLPGRIVDERAWVAVAIAPGASARLQAAIAARDSTYNSSSAVTAYAAEARNENV